MKKIEIYLDNIDKYQLDLDLKDAYILSFMNKWRESSPKITVEGETYFICYSADIIKNNELIGIKSKAGVRDRYRSLKNREYLNYYLHENSVPYFSFRAKAEAYLSDNY